MRTKLSILLLVLVTAYLVYICLGFHLKPSQGTYITNPPKSTIYTNEYWDHNTKANEYLMISDYPNAIKEYKIMIKLQPKSHDAYEILGQIYEYRMLDYSKAIDVYKNLVKVYPDNTFGHIRLANLYYKMKDNSNFEIECKELTRIAPNDADIKVQIAQIYQDNNSEKKAMKMYIEEMRKDPHNIERFNKVVDTLRIEKDFITALDICKEYIANNPDEPIALSRTGVVYQEKGDYKNAIIWQKKALAFEPNCHFYLTSLGEAYLSLKDFPKAVIELKKAVSLAPQNTLAKTLLDKAIKEQTEKESKQK